MLAEAMQVDLATLLTGLVAFLGGGAGTHVLARRGRTVESSAAFEERIRRETQLDANVRATSKQVEALTRLVAEVTKNTQDNTTELRRLGFHVDMLVGDGRPGGATSGAIPVGAAAT